MKTEVILTDLKDEIEAMNLLKEKVEISRGDYYFIVVVKTLIDKRIKELQYSVEEIQDGEEPRRMGKI
jgi:hypothetical protein